MTFVGFLLLTFAAAALALVLLLVRPAAAADARPAPRAGVATMLIAAGVALSGSLLL